MSCFVKVKSLKISGALPGEGQKACGELVAEAARIRSLKGERDEGCHRVPRNLLVWPLIAGFRKAFRCLEHSGA